MHFKYDSEYIRRAHQRVAMVTAGGVLQDSRALRTAQTLSKLGYQVCLYGMNSKDARTTVEGYPFEVVLLPHPRFEMQRLGWWPAGIRAINYDDFTGIFARYLQDDLRPTLPEFLHTYGIEGLAIGGRLCDGDQRRGPKWVHDVQECARSGGFTSASDNAFFCRIEEDLIRFPRALTSASAALSDVLQDLYSLRKKPSLVLNTPRRSDFDRYYPQDVRTALAIPQGVPLLVYLGDVKPTRGVYTLLEGLSLVPEVHLAIVAGASQYAIAGLQAIAEELGVDGRVHLHKAVSFYSVASFLRTATAGVSVSQPEVTGPRRIPEELFEFVHAGLPSVVLGSPAAEDFVSRHDCGVVAVTSDACSLGEAVTSILDRAHADPSWQQSLQALSGQYSWEAQEPVIASIYAALGSGESCNKGALDEFNPGRVLCLPTHGAGQPAALANALRDIGVAAFSLAVHPSKLGLRTDYEVQDQPNDLNVAKEILQELVEEYDVFHFFARPLLFAYHYLYPSCMDMLLLRAAGKKVFFHFIGFEGRVHSVFQRCNPYNYIKDNPDNIVSNFRENEQRLFIEFARGVCNGISVLDQELQTYIPNALILPRIIDLQEWDFVGTEPSHVLRVVHAPTRSGVKGTQETVSVVEQLRSEGISIEFRLVEGVPHDQAKEVYRWADVIIDQLKGGWYGVLAVEAMALGKAVVCYIRDDLKHYLPYPFPLAIANQDNLYQVLKDLASDPEEVRSLGRRGRAYVEELHDAETVAEIALHIYQTEANPLSVRKVSAFLAFQKSQMTARQTSPSANALAKPLEPSAAHQLRVHSRPAVFTTRNVANFFRLVRREGVRVAVRRAYNLFFR